MADKSGKSATVKVRLLTSRVVQSPAGFVPQKMGQIVEMSPVEADRHFELGMAEPVDLNLVNA